MAAVVLHEGPKNVCTVVLVEGVSLLDAFERDEAVVQVVHEESTSVRLLLVLEYRYEAGQLEYVVESQVGDPLVGGTTSLMTFP